MASVLRNHDGNSIGGKTKRISAGALQSVTTLLLLCAKQAIIVSKKLANNSKISPGSPKKLMSTISNKAIKLRPGKKRTEGKGAEGGDEGLWRREILMGDKCQPLDFSGVIYYDKDGNRLAEMPMRSPRASPLPSYALTPAKSSRTTPRRRESPSQ